MARYIRKSKSDQWMKHTIFGRNSGCRIHARPIYGTMMIITVYGGGVGPEYVTQRNLIQTIICVSKINRSIITRMGGCFRLAWNDIGCRMWRNHMDAKQRQQLYMPCNGGGGRSVILIYSLLKWMTIEGFFFYFDLLNEVTTETKRLQQ